MALIIEDGSIVPGADSFATVAELADYAERFGRDLPEGETAREALLRQAALQMQVMRWKGWRVAADQSLSWPREGVCIDGGYLASNYIPARIQYGQMALATEIYADEQAPPDQRQGPVTREKVDVIEVEYQQVQNNGKLLWAAPERPSRAQFADYLNTRGLLAVRS